MRKPKEVAKKPNTFLVRQLSLALVCTWESRYYCDKCCSSTLAGQSQSQSMCESECARPWLGRILSISLNNINSANWQRGGRVSLAESHMAKRRNNYFHLHLPKTQACKPCQNPGWKSATLQGRKAVARTKSWMAATSRALCWCMCVLVCVWESICVCT